MSNSDSDEENVIKYGTPLEPYEEDEVPVKKKFQKDQSDQHALDTQGRRRFHGAFTGGFSAGYGNSVGTPEGWIPAAFKSSRSDKVRLSNIQRPEDFMDEEDRSEFGIAPKVIRTQNDFSGQKRPHQQRFHDGPIPGEPVLEQLLRPVHETAAVKMLRAMGWRPGQGTGERLNAGDKKKAKDNQKVYGCYLPMEMQQASNTKDTESSSSSESEFDYDTLFAPDDYEPYILRRKNDRFGLGYSGLSRHSVLGSLVGEYNQAGTSSSHLLMKDKGKKVSIRGQAFGVGALEDDDEDIYAKEDMSHYDFTLGAEKQMDKKKSEQKSKNVLEGFVKASKPLPSVPSYPPPAVPRDYTPAPAGTRRTRFEPTAEPERNQALGRHELSSEARGTLLGEKPLPEPKSPPKVTEDPIAKLVGRNVVFTNDTPDYIPINSEPIGNYKVFKPFAGDFEKQRRYEKFLKDRDPSSVLENEVKDRLSEWERNRELVEFEQAAKLYKPLTGAMGDRFTHASQPDDAVNPLSVVAKSSNRHGLATQEQMDAASMGMYGALTRTQTEWRPDPLVCKRFNVPDPFSSKPDPKKTEKPSVSYSIFNYLESSVHDKDSFTKEQSTFSGSKSLLNQPKPKTDEVIEKKIVEESMVIDSARPSTRLTVAELFMNEFEKDKEKPVADKKLDSTVETINKFDKMALYKCIFLSDEEEEVETITDNKNDYKESSYTDFMELPKNVERNSSPPRGIFANIDFDELNSWKKFDEKSKADGINNSSKETEEMVNDNNLYGPKLPDTIVKVADTVRDIQPSFRSKSQRGVIVLESSASSDSWVELTESKVKKQKKKKHKHKSKSKKSKHKNKDR